MEYFNRTVLRITEASRNLATDQSGVTALEYGLIAALVAGVIIAGVTLLGTNLNLTFSHMATSALH
jgi:pilus assembly protein Flp/PilA